MRFDFSIKSGGIIATIKLYSNQWDEEVSGQVYFLHPMLHIVNPVALL